MSAIGQRQLQRQERIKGLLAKRGWRLAATILALALLALLFFWRLAFSGLILARGDTFLYFYPYWQAASDALARGSVPLWN